MVSGALACVGGGGEGAWAVGHGQVRGGGASGVARYGDVYLAVRAGRSVGGESRYGSAAARHGYCWVGAVGVSGALVVCGGDLEVGAAGGGKGVIPGFGGVGEVEG